MQSSRILKLIIVAAMLLCAAALIAKEAIKIGVVLPLTGSNAFIGERAREAIQMRLKELGDGGMYDYKVFFEDDGLLPSRSVLAVQKLKNVDHINILITIWGYNDDAIAPLLKNSGILMMSAHSWIQPMKETWYVSESADQHIAKVIDLLKVLKIKRMAWFWITQQTTKEYAARLNKALQGSGIENVENLWISDQTRDYRTWLLKVKEAGVDAICDMGGMPASEILHKEKQELGLDIPIINVSGSAIEISKELTQGEYFVYATPATEEFKQRYATIFHKECRYPVGHFYNAIDLLVSVCEKIDDKGDIPTAEQISNSMAQIKEFKSATGVLYNSPPNRFEAPIAYSIFEDGKVRNITLDQVKQYKGARK